MFLPLISRLPEVGRSISINSFSNVLFACAGVPGKKGHFASVHFETHPAQSFVTTGRSACRDYQNGSSTLPIGAFFAAKQRGDKLLPQQRAADHPAPSPTPI